MAMNLMVGQNNHPPPKKQILASTLNPSRSALWVGKFSDFKYFLPSEATILHFLVSMTYIYIYTLPKN